MSTLCQFSFMEIYSMRASREPARAQTHR